MKRLKVLPLSLRGKKRYVKIISKEPLTQNFENSIFSNFKKLFGVVGFSLAKIKVVYQREKEVIFRCSYEYVPHLIIAIGAASFGSKFFLKIKGVSGSIKKLKAK